jgi:hypothetical protein
VNVASTVSTRRDIISKGGPDGAFSLWLDANADRATFDFLTTSGNRQTMTLNTAIVDAGWTHLAFTSDGTGWRAYVNGVVDQASATGGVLAANTSAMVIGRDGGTPQRWYDGRLSDVALYPYALSAEQIAHHYAQRTVAGVGAGEIAYAIEPNSSAAVRSAVLTVGGIAIPVSQAPTGGITIVGNASPEPNAAVGTAST